MKEDEHFFPSSSEGLSEASAAQSRSAAEEPYSGHTQPVAYCEYRVNAQGVIIQAGTRFQAITGFDPAKILGRMSHYDLIPAEDLEDYLARVGEQFQHSNTAYLRHRIRRADGTLIFVTCHGERHEDPETGVVEATIQVYEVMDETRAEYRRRQEEARKLREMNQTITSLLNNIPGLSFTKDAHTGVYLACNQAFAEYAHKDAPEGVVGLTDAEIFDAETAGHFVEDDQIALTMDHPYIFFEDVLDAVGNKRQFQTTKLKYTDPTGRLCLQGMCQDVTDMVRISRENASNKAAFEQARTTSIIYTHIAHALARGYRDLYYVNLDNGEFIEYHTDDRRGVLREARRGSGFFASCQQDAERYIYSEDRERYLAAVNRDFLLRALDQSNVFEMTYRRIDGDRPFYVRLTVSRMDDDRRYAVLAVSDIDELIQKRRAEERIQEERIIYARLHALTGNFLCVYVVDPETKRYREFTATKNYSEHFKQPPEGDNFFDIVRHVALQYNHPEDLLRFLASFTEERVMAEIARSGIFTLGYRVLVDGRSLHVQMKAAMVEEKEGPRLIIGLNDIDAQVRQEEEYSRRLAAAQMQANVDALTGVRNKHAYLVAETQMDHRIAEGRQAPFAVVIFDVNGLKKVNDTAGHQAGDQYLQRACTIICDIFKHSPVFRVGGDEFAVLCQGRDYQALETRMEQVSHHNAQALRSGGIVIACGMARFQSDSCVAAVFERADHKMYENKNWLKSAPPEQ